MKKMTNFVKKRAKKIIELRKSDYKNKNLYICTLNKLYDK